METRLESRDTGIRFAGCRFRGAERTPSFWRITGSSANLRRAHGAFTGGAFRVTAHNGGLFAFVRENAGETLLILINRASFTIRYQTDSPYRDLYTGTCGEEYAEIDPDSFRILKIL